MGRVSKIGNCSIEYEYVEVSIRISKIGSTRFIIGDTEFIIVTGPWPPLVY